MSRSGDRSQSTSNASTIERKIDRSERQRGANGAGEYALDILLQRALERRVAGGDRRVVAGAHVHLVVVLRASARVHARDNGETWQTLDPDYNIEMNQDSGWSGNRRRNSCSYVCAQRVRSARCTFSSSGHLDVSSDGCTSSGLIRNSGVPSVGSDAAADADFFFFFLSTEREKGDALKTRAAGETDGTCAAAVEIRWGRA